jgi:E3 ubiquitin-protein ligase RNF5
MEHNFFEPELHFESAGDVSIQQKWKAISAPTTISDKEDGCFDCNICLESAHEPVVTLCGHLYCWPCIYEWLQVQISADESDPEQNPEQTCPVCKANISQASLVPLYGRGASPSDSKGKKPHLGLVIPNRPSPCGGLNTLISTTTSTSHSSQRLHPNYFQSQAQSQSFHHQQYFPHPYEGHDANASTYLGGTAMTGYFSPTIGMFGEMVYARMFGSSYTSLYPYPASYPPTGISSTRRMRRQEMQLDKSLNRLSIFLLCCIILCLIVF